MFCKMYTVELLDVPKITLTQTQGNNSWTHEGSPNVSSQGTQNIIETEIKPFGFDWRVIIYIWYKTLYQITALCYTSVVTAVS